MQEKEKDDYDDYDDDDFDDDEDYEEIDFDKINEEMCIYKNVLLFTQVDLVMEII